MAKKIVITSPAVANDRPLKIRVLGPGEPMIIGPGAAITLPPFLLGEEAYRTVVNATGHELRV